MHLDQRHAAHLACVIAALLMVAPVLGAETWRPDPRIETAVPEPSVIIDAYEGSLHPINTLAGNIHDTSDDFDWWCLDVTAGVPVSVGVQATGGSGGLPNCGLVQGLANEGDAFETLGQILAATNNGANPNASFTYTPDFTGSATVWVSSAGHAFDMDYSVQMSGGQFNPDCGPTDVGISKTVNNATPNVGQAITYTVTATNNGQATATGVQATDLLPAGVTYQSHTVTQGLYTPGTGVWGIGTLTSGTNATLTITVQVNSGTGCTTITNTASVTALDQTDPVPGNDTSSATITVQCADLRVVKSVNNATPNVGQNVTYTVVLTNLGPNNATNIVVTDLLPAGVAYQSHTVTQGLYTPGTGVWVVGGVANGAGATLTITAQVNTGTGCTTITNTASVTAVDQADPVGGNNSSSVNIIVQCADLLVVKTVNNPTPNVGQNFIYTVVLTDLGPNNATNIVVTDLLPAGVTYQSHTATQGSYTPGTGAWAVGNVANGASATLLITVRVNAGTGCQTITNTALVTAVDQADLVPGNNTSSVNIVVQCADLRVVKTVDNPTPNAGQNVAYAVVLTNLGPSNATSVQLRDLLDSRLTFVSGPPGYDPVTGIWDLGNVPNGSSANGTITARVNPGTACNTIPNTAAVNRVDQADPAAGNDSSSVNIVVQCADLGMTKSVDNPAPNVGQNVTYTVRVANGGANNATNVRVEDVLASRLTYVSHNVTQGSYTPGTGVWLVGTVLNGQNATLTLTATVNPGSAGQQIPNTGSVAGADQEDPVAGNNAASVTITVGCPDVDVSGTVTYYSNDNPILPDVPDPTCVAVRVEDCSNPAHFDSAFDATYSLAFGDGPIPQICICASRPKADCNGYEGGVISGADLILLEDFVAQIGSPPTPRQTVAGDLNRDGRLLANDELAIKQWIAHGEVCSGNTCVGLLTDNCAGTWRFLYPTGPGPSDFATDSLCLADVCVDQTVDIEGVLVGDVDGSWPNVFPKPRATGEETPGPADVALSYTLEARGEGVVQLRLAAELEQGEALHHVIYSLEYDPASFEYIGARLGAGARDWGLYENPAQAGVVHGIVHRLGGMEPITRSGEVLVFGFRARGAGAGRQFAFSRLLANDRPVELGEGRPVAPPMPTRYALDSYPNPFNPSTRVRFAIPEPAGPVPVVLRVYDIAGRLVQTLAAGEYGPGFHDVMWNGTDGRGQAVGTGVYLIHLRAGAWSGHKKVALIK